MAYGPFDLSGKTALVTGGNGGIGLGMADAMAQSGANVCIWGTNAEKNAAALEQLSTQVRQRPAAEDPLEKLLGLLDVVGLRSPVGRGHDAGWAYHDGDPTGATPRATEGRRRYTT